jgi:hypothetical protein
MYCIELLSSFSKNCWADGTMRSPGIWATIVGETTLLRWETDGGETSGTTTTTLKNTARTMISIYMLFTSMCIVRSILSRIGSANSLYHGKGAEDEQSLFSFFVQNPPFYFQSLELYLAYPIGCQHGSDPAVGIYHLQLG